MSGHEKLCTLCNTPRHVLVRCQIDETGIWHLVCPGTCWRSVSGGEEDAKGLENEYPHYRYGGMWKNKHADGPVSARKPKKVKERQKMQRAERQGQQGEGPEQGGEQDEMAEEEAGLGQG